MAFEVIFTTNPQSPKDDMGLGEQVASLQASLEAAQAQVAALTKQHEASALSLAQVKDEDPAALPAPVPVLADQVGLPWPALPGILQGNMQ